MIFRQHVPEVNGTSLMEVHMRQRMSRACSRSCISAKELLLAIATILSQRPAAVSSSTQKPRFDNVTIIGLIFQKLLHGGNKILLTFAIAICSTPLFVPPSHAQLSGAISAETDSWFRGRSISRGQPVISGGLSYDDESGIYVDGSVAFTIGEQTQGPLSYIGSIGYATNIAPNVSVDSGAVVTAYTERYSGQANDTFVEFYSGISHKNITGRVRYSPNFQESDTQTVYFEIDAAKRLAEGLNLTAHAGLLQQVGGQGSLGERRSRYDLQLGLAQDIGLWTVRGTINYGGDRGGTFFMAPWRLQDAIIIGVVRNF